jgi:3-hydroxyacyl-CoA dehydrogenase
MHDVAERLNITNFGRCMMRLDEGDLSSDARERVRSYKKIDRRLRSFLQEGINDGSITLVDAKVAAFSIAGALNWICVWYEPAGTLTRKIASQFAHVRGGARETRGAQPFGAGVTHMIASTIPEPAVSSLGREPSILIRKAAVLGAGTVGSRIAAHLANAGLPVVMLDIAADSGARSNIAAHALEELRRGKPAAFYEPSLAERITIGNFDDDLARLADCDWVIEAVAENLAIKRALLEKVAPHLKRDAILTTNTSGLPVASVAAGLPEQLRRRCFGTQFFNPPRYMRLVEIIATPETDPAALEAVWRFADLRLGKEVVFARDTPNFIANRVGVTIMLAAVRLMQEEDLSIEEVDLLTGALIGWPRTGTFRLADLVGLDVLAQVARNLSDAGVPPPFLQTLRERGWLGDKTRQGFYKKEKDAEGKETRFAPGRRWSTGRRQSPGCRHSRWRRMWSGCRSG